LPKDNPSNFNLEVTTALVPNASSILLDPEVGAFQAIASKALPGKTGLIVALEATGYDGNPSERESHILTSWSVEKAKRMGADAVKLLVYYHPNSKKATQIKELVLHVADECNKLDMLFILEPLTYSINPTQKTITGDDCKQTVIETARQLTVCGGDILKTE
ncbi:MAG: tagatose-bisphosphate aldolase, partial [Bacillota bacterium]